MYLTVHPYRMAILILRSQSEPARLDFIYDLETEPDPAGSGSSDSRQLGYGSAPFAHVVPRQSRDAVKADPTLHAL